MLLARSAARISNQIFIAGAVPASASPLTPFALSPSSSTITAFNLLPILPARFATYGRSIIRQGPVNDPDYAAAKLDVRRQIARDEPELAFDVAKAFARIHKRFTNLNSAIFVLFRPIGIYFARRKNMEGLFRLMDEMTLAGLKPDLITYNVLLKLCGTTRYKEGAQRWFDKMKEVGMTPSIISYNIMINICAESNDLRGATQFFGELTQNGLKPDSFTYATILKATARSSNSNSVPLLRIFDELKRSGVEVGPVGINVMLQSFAATRDEPAALKVLADAKSSGLKLDDYAYNSMILLYAHLKKLDEAQKWFNSMKTEGVKPNGIQYGTLIYACEQVGNVDLAMDLFEECIKQKIPLVSIGLSLLVKLLGAKDRVEDAIRVFERAKRSGTKPSSATYTTLMATLINAKEYDRAYEYLEEMESRQLNPSLMGIVTVLRLCTRTKNVEKAEALWNKMQRLKAPIGVPQYSLLMSVYASVNDLDNVLRTFDEMKAKGFQPGLTAYQIIMRVSDLQGRLFYVGEMKKAGFALDLSVYNLILDALVAVKDKERVIKYFDEMLLAGISPDRVTLAHLSRLGLHYNGKGLTSFK